MNNYETNTPSDSYCLNTEEINESLSLLIAKEVYKTNNQIYCYCKYKS